MDDDSFARETAPMFEPVALGVRPAPHLSTENPDTGTDRSGVRKPRRVHPSGDQATSSRRPHGQTISRRSPAELPVTIWGERPQGQLGGLFERVVMPGS